MCEANIELFHTYMETEIAFQNLLKEENNSYIFADQYRDKYNNSAFQSQSLIKILLFFSSTILGERKRCRRHDNDMRATVYENTILENIKILFQEEFLGVMLDQINKELAFRKSFVFDEKDQEKWTNYFGDRTVHFDKVVELKEENIQSVYDNIYTLQLQYDFVTDMTDIIKQHLSNVNDIHDFLIVLMR
jgi:hypothetical protein